MPVGMRTVAASLVVLTALVANACAPAVATSPAGAPRRGVCGWKDYLEATPTLVLEGDQLRRDGRGAVVAIRADESTPFGAVREAVGRRPELVRLEVVIHDRWVLPVTYVGEPLRPPEPRPDEEVAIVGHRKVIRKRGAPRVRVADVRQHRDGVELFVESGKPGGRSYAVSELEAVLARLSPPVDALILHADDDVPWRDFVALVQVAGCFARGPGEEPHELLWDERDPP